MSTPILVREGIPDLLPSLDRSPGKHVSAIIHYLCLRLGHYQEDETSLDGSPLPPVMSRMQLGQALEQTLADRYFAHYPGRYIRIGEVERDGLYGTPDLIDTHINAVDELKLTWMSLKHGPDSDKFWKYWVQLKAYCYMLDTPIGHLHVCYINGDYRWTRSAESGVVYRVWQRTFTKQDLAENWKMLLTNAEKI